MGKILRLAVVVLTLLIGCAGFTYAQSRPITIMLDGKQIQTDTAPVIQSGRTLVPVAVIAKNLGGQSSWDGKAREVAITYGQTQISLKIDSQDAYINGNLTKLDVPATIINNRTIVPLRFISEAMQYDVQYDATNKQVLISSPAQALQNIQSVSVSAADNACRVEIKGAAAFTDYTTMSLTDPERFVVDMKRTAAEAQSVTPAVYNAFVTSVRASQFTAQDARIVVDLTGRLTPVVSLSADKTSLYLDFGSVNTAQISRGEDESGRLQVSVSTQPAVQDPAGTAAAATGAAVDEFLFGSPGDASTGSQEGLTGNPYDNYGISSSANPSNMVPFDGPMLVVLDPGHGGRDPGALGKQNGQTILNEKDVNLAVALRIREKLEAAGVSVYMTRDSDVAVILASRPAIANELNAALFVGIHNNASNSSAIRGTEVIYYNKETDARYGLGSSQEIAEVVGNRLISEMSALGLPFNKYSERPGLAVMNKSSMPAILIEGAYLSNASDRVIMQSEAFVEAYANAVANGIYEVIINRKQTW